MEITKAISIIQADRAVAHISNKKQVILIVVAVAVVVAVAGADVVVVAVASPLLLEANANLLPLLL